jgi:hypothetical protein
MLCLVANGLTALAPRPLLPDDGSPVRTTSATQHESIVPSASDNAWAMGKADQLPSNWTEKVDVVYQWPADKPVGVLAMFHGCAHSATDFWPAGEKCPECHGLPEQLMLTRAALNAGWVAIALSSKDRDKKCWSWDDDENRVGGALRELQSKYADSGGHKLADLPLVAFGASSGGSFAARLPQQIKVSAVISQIASPTTAAFADPLGDRGYPPVLFMPMGKDSETVAAVQAMAPRLPKAEVQVLAPLPVTHSFFSDRIAGVSSETSAAIVDALIRASMLDSSGYLTDNPRGEGFLAKSWRSAVGTLAEGVPGGSCTYDSLGSAHCTFDSLVEDQSPVAQLLNVAYGMHEISAEHVDEMMTFMHDKTSWLIKTKKSSSSSKAKKEGDKKESAGADLSSWKRMHSDDDEGSNDDE